MRVLDSRFLRGPNIYRMGPCFVALLDFEGHRTVRVEKLQGNGPFLQMLIPGSAEPVLIDAAKVAGLLARLMFAAQTWAGSPATFCDTLSLAPTAPDRYQLLCDYQDEAVAEEALRIAVAFVTALLKQQPFDFGARLDDLRSLTEARAAADQALISVARERITPLHGPGGDRRIPVVAVTGTNGKTTTTQLIAHVLRACGARTGSTTTQGIYIDGQCVETGDGSGYWSARRVLNDPSVEVATLETPSIGILNRGLAFDRCDVGVVLNVSGDHLGIEGGETPDELAHVKGLVARCARVASVLNADDALCVAIRDTLSPGCKPVFFTMDPRNPVLLEHLGKGGSAALLDDDGWLVWCRGATRSKVVRAADIPFTLAGHARHNTANALAALAALRCLGYKTAAIARSLTRFDCDASTNPLRGNLFEVDGVTLIVDSAHNVAAIRALCDMARSMHNTAARLLGVISSPDDRSEALFETGRVCGIGFDELVIYEHHPRGQGAGPATQEILRGARSAAPGKPLHAEPRIRQALSLGLAAANPGDMLVFNCVGTIDDVIEGIRLKNPAGAERIARELEPLPRARDEPTTARSTCR